MALSVGWSVCLSVGLQNILKNSNSRFGDYKAVFCTIITTILIAVLYRYGRLVGRSVSWSVGLQNILRNSKSRFGDYIAVVCTLINTVLIIVLYRHGRLVGRWLGWSVGNLVVRSVIKIF